MDRTTEMKGAIVGEAELMTSATSPPAVTQQLASRPRWFCCTARAVVLRVRYVRALKCIYRQAGVYYSTQTSCAVQNR